MACIKPKPAWIATLPNADTGKHSISFKHKDKPADYWIGCGKCEGCTAQKRLEWAIRITHESKMHERNCFITLTYNEQNCPEKINRTDPQKFIKRLRHHSGRPIRYFLTGEYGSKTKRPHYHAILFGEDFLGGAYTINDQLYGSPIANGIWKHGQCTIGELTMASAMYTAGYTAKKIDDEDTFSIMSKNPPIGATWLKQNYSSILHLDKCIIEGREYPVPKAYMRLLDGDSEIQKMKARRTLPNRLSDQQLDAKSTHYNQFKSKRKQNEVH